MNDTNTYANRIKCMIGKKASDWILKQGNFNSLFDLKGNVILLEFSGKGCGKCEMVKNDIFNITVSYKEKGFKTIIIEITTNSKGSAQISFLPESNLQAFSYIDFNDIKKKYQVEGFPTLFLIDKKGVIRYVHVSYFYGNTKSKMLEEIDKLL